MISLVSGLLQEPRGNTTNLRVGRQCLTVRNALGIFHQLWVGLTVMVPTGSIAEDPMAFGRAKASFSLAGHIDGGIDCS